jgi:hypothetical protein
MHKYAIKVPHGPGSRQGNMQTSNRKEQLRFGAQAEAAQVALGPARDVTHKIACKTSINETTMGSMRAIEEGGLKGSLRNNG